MTAEVVALPTAFMADDTIRRTIKALVEGKGVNPDDVAEAAGISRSTYFSKMAGKGSAQAFKAGEVARIATFLGVTVAQLYDGLGGTFVPPQPPPDGTSVVGIDGHGVTNRYSHPYVAVAA